MRERIVAEVRRRRLVGDDVLAAALARLEQQGGTLTAHLVAAGADPDQLVDAFAAATGLTRAPAALLGAPDRAAVAGVDAQLLWRLGAAPFSTLHGALHVAFADPELAAHAQLFGLPRHTAHLARADEVQRALAALFGPAPVAETAVVAPLPATQVLPPRAAVNAVPLGPSPFVASASPNEPTMGATPPVLRAPASMPVVERFAVEGTLGEGGMATVYRARDATTGRPVALKVIQEHHAQDKLFIERFKREVMATAKLSHPHIVEVIAWSAEKAPRFMATELMDGGDLHRLKDRFGRIPALLAAKYAYELLAALSHAHQHGLVHRDVKPANLLLSATGALKVTDFGIAKVAGDATLTATGFLVGTPAYMSPEQARGDPIGPPSDLFSAGVVLYELLSGHNPFWSDNPAISLVKIGKGDFPPIFEVDPSIPGLLEGVVERLLAVDLERRYQSADDALRALSPLVDVLDRALPDAASRALQDPTGVREQLRALQAEGELQRGRVLAQQGDGALPRAAVAYARAALLMPGEPRAKEALAEASTRGGFKFFQPSSPRLLEVMKALLATPEAPGLLKRAADVARADGDLLAAATFLKRYLKVRPQDTHAAMQLTALVGDVDVAAPLGAGGTSVLVPRLDTAQIMAGVKTGGMRVAGPSDAPVQAPVVIPLADARPGGEDATVVDVARALLQAYGKPLFLIGGAVLALFLVVKTVGAVISGSQKVIDEDIAKMEARAKGRVAGSEQTMHYQRAVQLREAGSVDAAIEAATQAIEMDRRSTAGIDALFLRAKIHADTGRRAEAIADADALMARVPMDHPRRGEAARMANAARDLPASGSP